MKAANRIWILMGKELSGSVTPIEKQELEDLLSSDPELWYSYELLQAVIGLDDIPEEFIREFKSLLEQKAGPEALNSLMCHEISKTALEVKEPLPSPKSRTRLAYAAAFICLAAMLGLGFFFLNPAGHDASLSAMNEIVAPRGSKTMITLTDGTSIWLNAGSKLLYPKNFSLENRVVYLTGEAYFTVAHNDSHSFVVHTKYMDVTDLGTVFNIKAYSGGSTTEATLIQGSIEVTLKNNSFQKILMRPKEKLVVHNNSGDLPGQKDQPVNKIFEVSTIKPFARTNETLETAWLTDKLIFRAERFEDLAKEMERRYNVTIAIGDEEIGDYELTGIFNDENIEQSLQLLQVIAPFKFKITDDKVLIYK